MTPYGAGAAISTPPIFRCSPRTSGTPMALIRSTSAGGNDSSMPYSTPIVVMTPPSAEKLRSHALPPWPIVAESFPNVKDVRDLLHAQLMRQLHILIEQRIVIPNSQHIIVSPKALQEPAVVQVRQVIQGRMEIRVLIVVAVEKTPGN